MKFILEDKEKAPLTIEQQKALFYRACTGTVGAIVTIENVEYLVRINEEANCFINPIVPSFEFDNIDEIKQVLKIQ